jgi:hypothetical protein
MNTVIANIADAEQPVISRLVLQIERPILGIRQLVVDVIAAEKEWTK